MIRDLLQVRPEPEVTADVCIVGAGAAGIILAVELVRLGKRAFLLDGGGLEIEEEAQEPYQSELAGLHHKGIHTGRFRAKGGTTKRWGGQILDLDSQDFEVRPAVPGSGWPFHKSALDPYYERALVLEGLADVVRSDDSVWRQIGLEPPSFSDLQPYFSRWCPEPDFSYLHRQVLEDSSSLTVWLHTNAVEPIFENETMRAIKCRTQTGIEAVFSAREFIFCLGTIESSRFFLQPVMAQHPWNRSGLLGKHFQDHIDCNVAAVEPLDRRKFHQTFDNVFSRGFKYHPKLRLSPDQQAEQGTLTVAGTFNFISDSAESLNKVKSAAKYLLRGRLSELHTNDLGLIVLNLPMMLRQAWRYSVEHRIYNPPDGQILFRVHCEQEPLSKSTITLANGRDSLGMLRTRLDWQISEREIDTIRKFVPIVQQSLSSLARLTPDVDLTAGNDAAFIAKCDDSNHHMGGMRMATSPADGVVDPDLLLFGTSNVYICSSAVFPTSGFSNPTHTLLALAVRLADHLS
jgi:choline dehydrogenase-like flavoprotein